MLVLVTPKRGTRRGWFDRLLRLRGAPSPGHGRPLSRSRRMLRIGIIAGMFVTVVPGQRGLFRLTGLLRARAAVRAEIAALEARRAKLEIEIRRYRSDPAAIERVAREGLDLVKRGETVYKFPSK